MSIQAIDVPSFYAERTPQAIALGDGDTGDVYTWADLHDRSARVARVLEDEFRVVAGDRVCVIADNVPQVFELQFACMRLGALFVPLNWRLAAAELLSIVQDADPALIVHDDTWDAAAIELVGKVGCGRLSWGDGSPAGGAGNGYERLLSAASPLRPRERDLGDYTHVLYTSGTTGMPKGSLSTHGTLHWHASNVAHGRAFGGRAHMLNPLPLFHAGGLLTMAMPVLSFGGRITTLRRFKPERMMAALLSADDPVTHTSLIPMMYAAIGRQPAFTDADLSNLRCGVVAGAIVPPQILQAWHARGARLQPQYGGTEMGPCALMLDIDDERDFQKAMGGSAGRPVFHTELRLVDLTTGDDCETGRTGEIWLRGPSITRGYWRQDPARIFTPGGWFRTGDAAWRDEDGYYYYSGRTKEMYKSGGENVYPAEVELVLAEHPDIAEIVVFGVPDPKWDEVGVAVIMPRPGSTPTLESVREFGAQRLARYKLPTDVVLVGELDRNATGKVARTRLQENYLAARRATRPPTA